MCEKEEGYGEREAATPITRRLEIKISIKWLMENAKIYILFSLLNQTTFK